MGCGVQGRLQICCSAGAWSSGGSLLLVGGVTIQVFLGRGQQECRGLLGVKPGRALFPRQGPLLEASSCSEGESEGQIVLLGLWATGQRGCLQWSQCEIENWQYACGVRPHFPPLTHVLLRVGASLLMSANFLLRGNMESADCTSLRQVETCAPHKARADLLDSVPGQ